MRMRAAMSTQTAGHEAKYLYMFANIYQVTEAQAAENNGDIIGTRRAQEASGDLVAGSWKPRPQDEGSQPAG